MSSIYGNAPNAISPSSPTASTEKSIKSCYAVVYELRDRKWAVSGEGGWSEVHLCHDSSDNSHRILAWTVKNQNVLMNCNVTGECSYKEKSKNFHSFTDENKNRFGLGFHKSESGLRQALHFLNATVVVIKQSKNSDLQGFSLGQGSGGGNGGMTFGGGGGGGGSSAGGGGGGGGGPPPNPYQSSVKMGPRSSSNMIITSPKSSSHNKPLPPVPNKGNNVNSYASPNHSSYNGNAHGNHSNNYNNTSHSNNNHSNGGMPKPPPFMSGGGGGSSVHSLHSQGSNKPKTPPPNPAGSASPHSKPPPPNPYQKQGVGLPSPMAQAQAQPQADAPPPAYSQQVQQSPRQPPPSMSQATKYGQKANPHANGQLQNGNYPQLQKPHSPYQSTTDSVKLSPVQASVHGDNEQKQQPMQKSPHMAEEHLPNYHLNNKQTKSLPSQPIGPIGLLKILPPKPQKLQSGDKKILNPDNVEHTVRVVHDKDTGEFHGLPQEWMEALNKQFGVKPHLLPSVKLNAYHHKIPKVLISLRAHLEDANAYKQVGIFRLAPNATDNNNMKATINKGNFESVQADFNVYANLIKVWFRDLPDPLLNCVDPTKIEMAQKSEDVAKVVSQFPEPQKSIFQWLCDMCCACAEHEKINKMGPQNLAIVIGPNLFNTDNFENPMKAMTFSGKVVQFFKLAIINRKNEMSNQA